MVRMTLSAGFLGTSGPGDPGRDDPSSTPDAGTVTLAVAGQGAGTGEQVFGWVPDRNLPQFQFRKRSSTDANPSVSHVVKVNNFGIPYTSGLVELTLPSELLDTMSVMGKGGGLTRIGVIVCASFSEIQGNAPDDPPGVELNDDNVINHRTSNQAFALNYGIVVARTGDHRSALASDFVLFRNYFNRINWLETVTAQGEQVVSNRDWSGAGVYHLSSAADRAWDRGGTYFSGHPGLELVDVEASRSGNQVISRLSAKALPSDGEWTMVHSVISLRGLLKPYAGLYDSYVSRVVFSRVA